MEVRDDMRIRMKKADMAAKSAYDYRWLEREHFFLIPCRIQEEKETICMNFDLRGMQAFDTVREEEKVRKLAVLLQLADLEELYRRYEFSLAPENLYFDTSGRIRAAIRDVALPGQRNRGKKFLRQFQALAGYTLEGSRDYEDYLSGGTDILKGRNEITELLEPETMREERRILAEHLAREREAEQKEMCKVKRRTYKRLARFSVVSFVLALLLSGAAFYSFAWYMPRQDRFMKANEAYLKKDYITMIDQLREFSVEELGYTQKVMLAAAYVQGQGADHFSPEDKQNILDGITFQSGEEMLDYWIFLGRLEVEEAQDAAMKMSDRQLLLYAYMYELDQLEEDEELPGQEKRGRQQELMKEIRELADELGISYGDGA